MSRSSSCSKSTKLYCVKSVSCILGIYYFTANHRLVHIYFTVFYIGDPVHVNMSLNDNAPDPAHAQQQHQKYFKLPEFWPSSPHAWFGIVEAQFRIRQVTLEEDRFTLVASVLPENSARKVAHLLSTPPADCYTQLKAALLSSHQLTDIQKSELLFNMDDLGSKRPMELLTEMMELVTPGEEKTRLFAMLFMHRLPAQVRVQLTEDDHTDLRALAEKAERCSAMLARKTGTSSVQAVFTPEDDGDEPAASVSAIRSSSSGQRNNKGGKPGFWQQKKQQQKRQPAQQSDNSSPAELARMASGLCFPHFKYGAKAFNCTQPCNWQGN